MRAMKPRRRRNDERRGEYRRPAQARERALTAIRSRADACSARASSACAIPREMARMKAREVAPVIVSLQAHLDELGRAEMERVRGKLGTLTPQQEEALAAYTRGLLNKIAHGPLTEIRRAATQPEGDRILTLIRRMFRLEDS